MAPIIVCVAMRNCLRLTTIVQYYRTALKLCAAQDCTLTVLRCEGVKIYGSFTVSIALLAINYSLAASYIYIIIHNIIATAT